MFFWPFPFNDSDDPQVIRNDVSITMKCLIEVYRSPFDDESFGMIFSLLQERFPAEIEFEIRYRIEIF